MCHISVIDSRNSTRILLEWAFSRVRDSVAELEGYRDKVDTLPPEMTKHNAI